MTLPHHSPIMILMKLISMALCTRAVVIDHVKTENGAWAPQVDIPKQDFVKVCIIFSLKKIR